mgnify:CR=1 FL=1
MVEVHYTQLVGGLRGSGSLVAESVRLAAEYQNLSVVVAENRSVAARNHPESQVVAEGILSSALIAVGSSKVAVAVVVSQVMTLYHVDR